MICMTLAIIRMRVLAEKCKELSQTIASLNELGKIAVLWRILEGREELYPRPIRRRRQ